MLVLFLYSLIQGVWRTSSSGEVMRKYYCWLGVKRAGVIKELCTYQWRSAVAELALCCYVFIKLEVECAHLKLWLGSNLTCVEAFVFWLRLQIVNVFWFWCRRVKSEVRSSTPVSHSCLRVDFVQRSFFFRLVKTTGKVWQISQSLWKQQDVWGVCLWKINSLNFFEPEREIKWTTC